MSDTGIGINEENQDKLFKAFSQADASDEEISFDPKALAQHFPHRILVVEDNSINQKLITLMLKKFGYSTDIAGNGEEAFEMVENHYYKNKQHYSLVFMDIQMPVLDGYGATKKIINKFDDKAPPIVAMAANAFKENWLGVSMCML